MVRCVERDKQDGPVNKCEAHMCFKGLAESKDSPTSVGEAIPKLSGL